MSVVVVTPPDPLAVLADVKRHLNVLFNDDDLLLTGMIAAVSEHLDGPNGWLGRAVGSQVLEWTLPGFPRCAALALPFTPVIGITSVTYDATDDTEQVWPAESYRRHDDCLLPVFNGSWPSARRDPLAVRIRYTAGHATVPASIRVAVLMMVAELYASRSPVTAAQLADRPKSAPVQMLLARAPRI